MSFAVIDGLTFLWRHRAGPRKGELDWQPVQHHTVLRVLHNSRYAGAFTYGRRHDQKLPGGKTITRQLPREEWISFIPGAYPGYITLDQYEANIAKLAATAAAHGHDRRRAGVPREGAALLQGIIICGHCGNRMTVRYRRQPLQQATRHAAGPATGNRVVPCSRRKTPQLVPCRWRMTRGRIRCGAITRSRASW